MLREALITLIIAMAAALMAPHDATTRIGRVGGWVRGAALLTAGACLLAIAVVALYHPEDLLSPA